MASNNNSDLSPSEVGEKVKDLRNRFLEKLADAADARDVTRVKTDDGWLKQFLYAKKHNVDNALTMMESTLKWRRDMEINDICEDNISDEVLEKGSIYFHSCDKDNHDILYVKIKDNKKGDPEYSKQVKRYLAYLLETHHTQQRDERIVVLMDATDMGMSNVDMDLLKYKITCFTTYFPCLLEYMLIFDMPWLAHAVWKIVKTWLTAEQQKRVLFCKKNEIQEYINKDKLWLHMGGTDDFQYKFIPKKQLANGGDIAELEASHSDSETQPETTTDHLSRSSSWSGQSDTTPAQKKQVTFNESSFLQHSRSSAVQAPRGMARPLLQSSCTEDINFPLAAAGTESRYVMTLSNTRTKPVAFKVKTTTPAGYRVRPGSDTVQPGTSSVVEIVCLPAHQEKCSKDRFLLMAAEVEGEDFDMRSVPPENLYTQRYNVSYGATESASSGEMTTKKSSPEQLVKLSEKVGKLLQQQKASQDSMATLQATVSKIYYLLLTLVVITCFVVIYKYFSSTPVVEGVCYSNPAEKYTETQK